MASARNGQNTNQQIPQGGMSPQGGYQGVPPTMQTRGQGHPKTMPPQWAYQNVSTPPQMAGQSHPNPNPPTPDQPNPSDKKHKGRRAVLIILACLVLVAVICLLIWLFAFNQFDRNAQDGQAPYKTAEEMQAELDRVVEEGMFNISITSVIEFADGTSEGTAYIENVPGNHYDMQVTITEDETGEELYSTGILRPNQFIENIKLSKDLDAGAYSATATFKALDQESHDEIGQAAAKVTLNVIG